MKKFLCLLTALVCLASTALAVQLEYTLPEKFAQQVKFGSGVKGTATLSASGGAQWLELLLPFTGTELQIRAIQTKEGSHLSALQRAEGFEFQYQIYALDEEGRQQATTWLYGDKTDAYIASDMLPDTILSIPQGGKLLEAILGSEGENPTIFSVIQSIADVDESMWQDAWLPALKAYESALEMWMDNYAEDPTVLHKADGSSSVLVRYEIPAVAVKAQMKAMMASLVQDQVLLSLLRPLMSVEQQAVYLNSALVYYYDAVIDALPLNGNVMLHRELSSLGEVLSTSVSLPLPENSGGWTELEYDLTGTDTTLSLMGDKTTVTLLMGESAANAETTTWTGVLRVLPVEGEKLSTAFSLRRSRTTSQDESGYGHEQISWVLEAEPELSHLEADDEARDEYLVFEPVSLSLGLHYYSKSKDNNPTTLEIELSAHLPTVELALSGKIKTSNAWTREVLSREGAEDLLAMSEERMTDLAEQFADNATKTMTALYATPEPIAAAEPTVEPEEVPDANVSTATDVMTEDETTPTDLATPVPPLD